MKSGRLAVVLLISSFTGNTLSAQTLSLANPEIWTAHIHEGKLPDNTPKLTVVVNDFAHLDQSVLGSAENIATEIFEESGIRAVWFECLAPKKCDLHTEGTQFRIAIHPRVGSIVTDKSQARQMMGDHTVGFAIPCSATDSICLSYIFYGPISTLAAQYGTKIDRILGHVMAHEIGHALLGPNAHTRTGVMQGTLRLAESAPLFYFTAEQSKRLRSELLARNGVDANIGSTIGR